jgi:hypothetical protein
MKIKISSSPLLIVTVWGKIFKAYCYAFINSTRLLKSCVFLLVFFQFNISDSSAQNFFPLKVGNAYQLKNSWYFYFGSHGDSGTDYYNLTVISDTLIEGEQFYSLSNNLYQYSPFKYECVFRYDSLNQKLYIRTPNDSTTRLAVDFNALVGSQYTSFIMGESKSFTSQGISYKVVLGDTFLVYSMKHPMGGGDFEYTYEFAANLGLSKYRSYIISNGYESSDTHIILAALVDSIKYNPFVLRVDSLYPVEDRPVDTFPFLLTIPHTASYTDLIDLFYLDVQQLRADTLVQTKKYNISKSNPHISFNLTGLLVGDQIKLKATITDTSIFYNVDHYPDTGWVVMNVLPPILNVGNENTPLSCELAQNYPNPFNPVTRIMYQIPEPVFVTIKVYDVLGNEIETLLKEEKIAGSYELEFNGSELTSGIYYYRITAGNFSETKKMILLK